MTCISGHISLLASGQRKHLTIAKVGLLFYLILVSPLFCFFWPHLDMQISANQNWSNCTCVVMGPNRDLYPGFSQSCGFCDRLGCRPIACPHTPERWLPPLNEADRQRDDGRRNTTETDGFEHVMTVTRLPRELGAESIGSSAVFSICRSSECCRG